MGKDNIDTIFEPFSRFERSIEGHGLGMSICKRIIDLLDIEVNITSDIEVGTRIGLFFASLHKAHRTKVHNRRPEL
ncbi:MAG: signal transduction histidine kinase [Alteromonadaceae bacterium]|jgi:signal transduction histidine kinase